ncbi:MAG: hypothetical protein WCI47_00685 [bacterium]
MTLLNKVKASALAVALTFMPLAAIAADSVRLESKLGVANASTGEKIYQPTTSAKTDETVQVQLWYHNMENPDSGKVANNLKAKLELPTAAGKVQKINGTISADNANTVNTNSTVNLELDQSRLEMVPGTAMWRHNKGTNEQPNWVTEGLTTAQEQQLLNGGVTLENEKPCFNFEATVTVKLQVKTQMVGITKNVRVAGEKEWKVENVAKAGNTLDYRIKFSNDGNTVIKNVHIADNMPGYVSYVPGSTKLTNMNNPNGVALNDDLTKGGVNVGDYAPGSVGYITFQGKIDPNLKAGDYTFKNVAGVKIEGLMKYAEAFTKVKVEGKVTPSECKPGIPVGDARCNPTVTPTPETPLPQTGMEGAAAGFLGINGITYAGYFYRKSRKQLTDTLRSVVK